MYASPINLGFYIDWGHIFAISQALNLVEDKLIIVSSACSYKAIKSDLDPNKIKSKKVAFNK